MVDGADRPGMSLQNRVAPTGEIVTDTGPARVGALPDGVMGRDGGTTGLLAGGLLLPWSFTGYGAPVRPGGRVDLLTPPSIVDTLAVGYRPAVHPSAYAVSATGGTPGV